MLSGEFTDGWVGAARGGGWWGVEGATSSPTGGWADEVAAAAGRAGQQLTAASRRFRHCPTPHNRCTATRPPCLQVVRQWHRQERVQRAAHARRRAAGHRVAPARGGARRAVCGWGLAAARRLQPWASARLLQCMVLSELMADKPAPPAPWCTSLPPLAALHQRGGGGGRRGGGAAAARHPAAGPLLRGAAEQGAGWGSMHAGQVVNWCRQCCPGCHLAAPHNPPVRGGRLTHRPAVPAAPPQGHASAIHLFEELLPDLPPGTQLHLVGNLMPGHEEYLDELKMVRTAFRHGVRSRWWVG